MIITFDDWLSQSTKLSESSIYKYVHAISTISREMLREHIIEKPLNQMELYEIDLAIAVIFRTESFLLKDTVGNHMYSSALKWYRCYIATVDNDEDEVQAAINKIIDDKQLVETDRVSIIKSRNGQGIFRDRLLSKYGKCIITGISIPQVLIASHIKPWAVSSNAERVDANNGLLLSATYDKLFDSGLISFTNQGKILISRAISQENINRLNISINRTYDLKIHPPMNEFLQYHNDTIFLK